MELNKGTVSDITNTIILDWEPDSDLQKLSAALDSVDLSIVLDNLNGNRSLEDQIERLTSPKPAIKEQIIAAEPAPEPVTETAVAPVIKIEPLFNLRRTIILILGLAAIGNFSTLVDTPTQPALAQDPVESVTVTPVEEEPVVATETKTKTPKSVLVKLEPVKPSVVTQEATLNNTIAEVKIPETAPAAAIQQPVITMDSRDPDTLLQEARTLLLERGGTYDEAIADLRSIIFATPKESPLAKTAQELIGYAFEKSRNFEKAMAEYSKYLALYPEENEDYTRVRQRLITLEIMTPKESLRDVSQNKTKKKREGDQHDISLALSEYLLSNSSIAGGHLGQWHNDQMQSITNISGGFSLQHNEYTLSSRLRFSEVRDFAKQNNRTMLSTVYVDLADTWKGYSLRLGRQPSVAGSMSRFDGISGKVDVAEDVKVGVAAGTPYIGPNNNTARKFVGAELDYTINADWTVDGYLNRQTADGFLERLAFGTDLYYRSKAGSFALRTEYDTKYHTVNWVSLQGTKYVGTYDLFAIYERRRSPLPYGDVALVLGSYSADHQPYSSVGDLLSNSGLTQTEIYQYISNSTPIASALVLGVSKYFGKNTSLTVNVQRSNVSTTPGFDISPHFDPIPLQVGQTQSTSLNAHLRESNFVVKDNTLELVANIGWGTQRSQYLTLADSYKLNDGKDTISAILRYDQYEQTFGRINSTSLMLRGIHTINKHWNIEAQYIGSLSTTQLNSTSTLPVPPNTNQNAYIGFRYDF